MQFPIKQKFSNKLKIIKYISIQKKKIKNQIYFDGL